MGRTSAESGARWLHRQLLDLSQRELGDIGVRVHAIIDISKMSIKHNCVMNEFLLSVVIKPKGDLFFADSMAGSRIISLVASELTPLFFFYQSRGTLVRRSILGMQTRFPVTC